MEEEVLLLLPLVGGGALEEDLLLLLLLLLLAEGLLQQLVVGDHGLQHLPMHMGMEATLPSIPHTQCTYTLLHWPPLPPYLSGR